MKKTIVLLTIVLAIVAAPVFAEVTASGDVDFRFGMNGDMYAEMNDNDVKVNLGVSIGDFTSIDATAEATNETGETFGDSDGFVLDEETGEYSLSLNHGEYLKLNQMSVTQDVTGALGMDAGFGLAMTFGIKSFNPKEYQAVAGYGDFEYDDDMSNPYTYNALDPGTIMTKASISLADMVTVDVAMYEPGAEVMSDFFQFGMNAYGTFGIVNASASFLSVADKTTVIGFNASAAPVDGLEVGAGMSSFTFDGDSATSYGVSAAYTMDALTAGVAMKSGMGSGIYDTGADFADVTSLAFNVNYMVTEAAKVFAGVMMPDLAGEADLGYEVGAQYVLDGVTYSVGYTDDSDYVAYPVDADGNVFFRVQASF